jgi:thiol-disulfide isomerase/thioredoxin
MKKTISTLAIAAMLASTAQAQLLTVKVEEPSMRENALIALGMTFDKLSFDSKGVAVFQGDTITQKALAYVAYGGNGLYAVLEPGKKLQVTVSGKGKLNKIKFKGDNAYESELQTELQGFNPTKDVYYEINNPQDSLSFPEAWKLLDEKYNALCKLVNKEKDADKRAKMQDYVETSYLSNRIQMQNGYCYKYGLNPKKDKLLAELMSHIDPNAPKENDRGLLQAYLYYKMPIVVDANTDINEYACEYLNTVCKEIQNTELKNDLLEVHVGQCVQMEEVDIEKFWALVNEKCDKSIVDKYQYIIDAKKSTASGTQCPDVTFSDIEGKSHKLSDYFGKVLYIDLWATWCGPCCMEIPYLEKIVEHYKGDDRVLFISISSDRDRKAWENKINEDKPQWPQFNTSREEDKLLSTQWGVASIPRFLIINADGTINNNDAFRPSSDDFIEKMDAILDSNYKK